ncbi:MAG: AMP-binding protein, partial [Desulfobulbaceae bacterium]|nr:AMP-binding protein [Desulfobulbaceae bacterium]
MANIAVALVEATRRGGGNTALIAKERGRWQRWTFSEIHAHTASYAGFLRGQGICPGDRVMLMVKPSKEFVCLAFALFAAGAVVILIDPGMGYRNLLRCIGSVKPSVLIGIPKAQLFSRLFRSPFVTIRRRICVG